MKQACLNALNCLVTVRFHQIEYLDNGNLRENLSDSLVFDKHNITAIKRSIVRLHDDKLLLKQRRRYSLLLTPSTPAVPNCCCSKGSAPYWSNPPFLIFDIRSLWRQSARMSKIKNGGLDQYGKCKALTGLAVKGLTPSPPSPLRF